MGRGLEARRVEKPSLTALFLWPHIQVPGCLHCLWVCRPGLAPITSVMDDSPSTTGPSFQL